MINFRPFMLTGLSAVFLLTGCGGSTSTSAPLVEEEALVSSYTVTTGRLLASQCAQCHGTNGRSVTDWDSIAGESASETIEEMREFQSGGEDEPIMEAQAHGYSDAEIEALAAWLATQSSSEGED